MKIKPLVLAPLFITAALAGLFLGGMYREDPDALPSALIGQKAPVTELSGLASYPPIPADAIASGEVKLVNFWASWCGPCRIEHPVLMNLAEQGMKIYGINYKDDPERAVAFLEELGDPYLGVGVDPDARAAFDWGLSGVPETFVVDGDGVVRLRFAGPVTAEIYEKRVRPAIEAARDR